MSLLKYHFEDWKKRGKVFIKEPHSHVWDYLPKFRLLIEELKPKSILDVGCGYGLLFDLYKEKKTSLVVGLDFSITQLENAKEKAKEYGIMLVQASATHLPFRNGTFDLSLSHTVLQHIPYTSIEYVSEEMLRVTEKWIFIDEYKNTSNQTLVDLAGHNIYVHDYKRLFSEMGELKEEFKGHTKIILLNRKVKNKMRILAVCRWGFDPLTRPFFYYWYKNLDVDVLLYLSKDSYNLNIDGATDLQTSPFIMGKWTDFPSVIDLEELKRTIEFYKPNIVYHGCIETYGRQAYARAKLFKDMGLKQVWAVSQNLVNVPSRPEEKEGEAKTIPLIDGFLACSKSVKERYDALGAKNVIVSAVGGVNTDVFRPAEDSNEISMLKIKHAIPGGFNIFYAGRIVEEKGIQIVLYALRDLFQVRPDLRGKVNFTIVGSPYAWAEKLIALIKKVGLERNVVYRGRIQKHEHVAEMERCMDVFVYPSLPLEGWIEQLGLSVVEASACGLPCIVSDIGGLKDVVDKETGFLIKPGNVEQMKNALLTLIESPKFRLDMGYRARAKMIDKYSFPALAKQQLEFMRL